jgi:hypothetical protein
VNSPILIGDWKRSEARKKREKSSFFELVSVIMHPFSVAYLTKLKICGGFYFLKKRGEMFNK